MESFDLRRIETRDDPDVAKLIRTVMPEFGASGAGFAIEDPEVDRMSSAFGGARARYYVVLTGDRLVGGGGYAPLAGADPGVCELQKMYFYPEARGHGVGKTLLARLLDEAKADGFTTCYLETLTGMDRAAKLYASFGFESLKAPMGSTGHFSCNRWMAKAL